MALWDGQAQPSKPACGTALDHLATPRCTALLAQTFQQEIANLAKQVL